MNEFILIEFLLSLDEEAVWMPKINALEREGIEFKGDIEWDVVESGEHFYFNRLRGKISSQRASMLKLQDPYLAERMRISYIPNSLKDKYRTK